VSHLRARHSIAQDALELGAQIRKLKLQGK